MGTLLKNISQLLPSVKGIAKFRNTQAAEKMASVHFPLVRHNINSSKVAHRNIAARHSMNSEINSAALCMVRIVISALQSTPRME